MNTYSIALEARVQWALHRVGVVAGNDLAAQDRLISALDYATRCGEAGGREDEQMQCPALLADVETLRDAFMNAFGAVCDTRQKRRTHAGIKAELDAIAKEAMQGCGLSYELYVKRYSQNVDGYLELLEPPFRVLALEIAKAGDYATAEELDAMQDEIEASGGCSLTGIDPDCCPCGRHE